MSQSDDDKTRMHLVLAKDMKIAHYQIERKIGAGGMGEVYLAEDTKLNRQVALKFMPTHLAEDEELRLRFTREAQAAAKLEHPNIITIYEVSEFQKRPFFAMQYIDGDTLHHYCHEEKLPVDKIVNLMTQVANGLDRAHRAGIVHRDIKSINILVDKEFRIHILDFGLATVQGTENLTKTGSTLGTIAYMSPEQALGKEVDHRTDIFSFGVILYELLCGVTPFKEETEAATLTSVINKEPEPAQNHNKDIPFALAEIVERCLQKDKNNRFQSASEIITALSKVKVSTMNNNQESNPSIAVLPFANMSADPENEFFADGLTEELLNVLAKNPQLKVTGRTSSFAFKGKQEDLRGIGNKLGVEVILEGSVRKAGNRVRITTQLVKTSDGFHLWSETYDRVIEDIFAVQDEIADAVAKELHVTLLGQSKKVAVVNIESYELVLKANQKKQNWSFENLEEAIALYLEAIKIDDTNARAYAGLARCYMVQYGYGYSEEAKLYIKAKMYGDKALSLDPNLAEANEVVAMISGAFYYDFRKSLNLAKKAYELAPNNTRMVSSLALVTALLADLDEAIELSKQALELDPLNTESYMNLGKMYLWNGDVSTSRSYFNEALKLNPQMASVYMNLSWLDLEEGKLDEAVRNISKEKLDGYRYCGEAMVYHALGDAQKSDEALNKLLDISRNDNWAAQIATVYCYRDETENTFKWLEIAYEKHDAGIPLLRVMPYFQKYKGTPRFEAMLKKIGFLEYLD